MKNENGYVIYPESIGIMDFNTACERAKELSAKYSEESRVEDCDTGETVARYRNGEELG